jgi:cell division protein FtsZ
MGEEVRITVIATGFDQHEPEEEVLGNAIAAHAHRVRRQSQQVVMPGMGISQALSGSSNKVQVQVPANSTLTRKPKREVTPRPSLNPMYGAQAKAPQAHAPAPQAYAPQPPAPPAPAAHESGGYPAPQVRPSNPGVSGGWSRGEVGASDPHEVPAFLRRRGEHDGGYVR